MVKCSFYNITINKSEGNKHGVSIAENNTDCSNLKYVSYVNKYMSKQQDNVQSLPDACSGAFRSIILIVL